VAQHKKMKSTHKKRWISLRQKAIASIFLTFALLTSYAFYFTIENEHHAAEREIIKAAQMKASLISAAISENILHKDETFLQRFVKQALGDRDIEYIEFVGRDGDVLAKGGLQQDQTMYIEKGGPTVQEVGASEGLLHKSGHLFNIRMPIVHQDKDVGKIQLRINTIVVNRRLARATYWGMSIFIATILTGLLLTYFMEGRMRGSLKKLIQTAGYMARGDLTRRVKIEIGDEVEELGESFNQMTQALAEKEMELKTYTEHLEEIAEEQTRKLKEAQVQIVHQEKMAALGQMVAGVAHEINNPNSFITYNIPLLEETWQLFEPLVFEYASAHPQQRMSGLRIEELCGDMRELIQDIKIGSDRINKIVSNLKDFARLDESSQFKSVQVNEVIEKTMAIVGAQVRKSVGKVKMDLDPNLPKIQGHFQKLEQVTANLIMNAVHAIPDKDQGRLFVTTRHVDRLGSVLIEIEDNGMGMQREVIERIFEPFFTTRRDAGGTGLGLSVSYSLIQEHNGIIGVLSRPGLGTRFTVYLPFNSEKKLDLRPLILCLDDDVEFLGLLNMYFVEVKNMSLETKNKPDSVIKYLENHPEVDIVLSDVMMPAGDGWKFIERIKARFPLLTVILYSSEPIGLKEQPDGTPAPDHFLQKPFTMEHLLKIINTNGRQRL